MCLWAVWLCSQFGKLLLPKLPSGGVAENFPRRICAEEAEGEMAVGPERAEVADHKRTGLVAGPVRSPCTYPSPATNPYARDRPALLRKHPGPGDQAGQGGRGTVDGEGLKGDKVRVFGRRVSLLRQLEAGSGYGLYSPALQGQAGAGLYLENRQGRRSDLGRIHHSGLPIPSRNLWTSLSGRAGYTPIMCGIWTT